MPPRTPWLRQTHDGFIALAKGDHPNGWTYLQPLEGMWGLPSPLVGPNPGDLARTLESEWAATGEWDVLQIGGFEEDSPTLHSVAQAFGRGYTVRVGYPCRRNIADFNGGVDEYLARKPRKFRQNLRRAETACRGAGVQWVRISSGEPLALYQRLLAIEADSWKGKQGVGINLGDMHDFYALMVGRLAERGHLRLLFGRVDDRDVAYVLGGVDHQIFRGLQFSFRDGLDANGLGNVGQLEMMRWLTETDDITTYDLGSYMAYKNLWSDRIFTTLSLLITR
jgi:hypothetical protein